MRLGQPVVLSFSVIVGNAPDIPLEFK